MPRSFAGPAAEVQPSVAVREVVDPSAHVAIGADGGRPNNRVHGICDQHVINEADWKEFFAQLGMTWPEGSSIRYVPSTGHMVVKSTPDNLDLFEKIISVPDFIPTQIEVEMQYVQFDREVIDSLSSKTEADASALLEMWRSGKGELVWSPRLLTQSGTEASRQRQTSGLLEVRTFCQHLRHQGR